MNSAPLASSPHADPIAKAPPPCITPVVPAGVATTTVQMFDLTVDSGLANAVAVGARPAEAAAAGANSCAGDEAARRLPSLTAARRVGNARRCGVSVRTSRHAAFAGLRTERRRTGARLLASAAAHHIEVPQAAFDPSKMRLEIQMGLQIFSQVRSQHGRECKVTASIGKSGDMSTLVGIRANYVFRTQRRRITTNMLQRCGGRPAVSCRSGSLSTVSFSANVLH